MKSMFEVLNVIDFLSHFPICFISFDILYIFSNLLDGPAHVLEAQQIVKNLQR